MKNEVKSANLPITKEYLKSFLDPNWFVDPTDIIIDSFNEYYDYIVKFNLSPDADEFCRLVNANVEEYYSCDYKSSFYY